MLTLRAEKGSPLTWQELDQNFKFTPRTDKYVSFVYELPDNGQVAITASNDLTVPLNVMTNVNLNCSLSSNLFTVPAGTYMVLGGVTFYRCGYTMVYLRDQNGTIYATSMEGMAQQTASDGSGVYCNSFNFLHTITTIPESVTLRLSARVAQSGSFGYPVSPSLSRYKNIAQLHMYKLD